MPGLALPHARLEPAVVHALRGVPPATPVCPAERTMHAACLATGRPQLRRTGANPDQPWSLVRSYGPGTAVTVCGRYATHARALAWLRELDHRKGPRP